MVPVTLRNHSAERIMHHDDQDEGGGGGDV